MAPPGWRRLGGAGLGSVLFWMPVRDLCEEGGCRVGEMCLGFRTVVWPGIRIRKSSVNG